MAAPARLAAISLLSHGLVSASATACADVCASATACAVNATTDPTCTTAVLWAMDTGISTNPSWYADYPGLSITGVDFMDWQYVTADRGEGGCPMPCNYAIPNCFDIDASSPGECYKNLLWAKATGIVNFPANYTQFSGLTATSPLGDFQYALATFRVDSDPASIGWQCPMPCSSAFRATPAPTIAVTAPAPASTTSSTTLPPVTDNTTTTAAIAEEESSMPWWSILLICIALIAACAGLVVLCSGSKKQPKTSKRALARTNAPREEAAAPPVVMQTYAAPPVATHMIPMQPMQYQQPSFQAHQVAYDPMMQQSQSMYVDPNAQYIDPNAALQLFDALDGNHSGMVSREELARHGLHMQ